MNDQDLLKWARSCADPEGDCRGCPFDRPSPTGGFCARSIISALAERVEKLGERCARYADMLAMMQEREHQSSVEEKLPDDYVLTDCDYAVIARWAWQCISQDAAMHLMPLPEGPEEVEEVEPDAEL